MGPLDQRILAEKNAVRVGIIGQVAVHRLLFATEAPDGFGEEIRRIEVEDQITVAIIRHLQMVAAQVLVSKYEPLFEGGQDALYNSPLVVVTEPEASIV